MKSQFSRGRAYEQVFGFGATNPVCDRQASSARVERQLGISQPMCMLGLRLAAIESYGFHPVSLSIGLA